MSGEPGRIILKGGHVIDPGQGIDRIADISIADGKIEAIGEISPGDGEIIDLGGLYVCPGWVDLHVHAYGTLGFGDPDSIGIYQGVTTMVDAGGSGIGTLDEFDALLGGGQTVTGLYAGPHLHPFGIIGLSYIEDEVRSFNAVPIAGWQDWMADHPGFVRYLKAGAYGLMGTMPLYMGKGVAELIGVPFYLHIGEYRVQENHPRTDIVGFDIVQSGDIVTHIYNGNFGNVLDDDGKVMPHVRAAERRGVIFDIGFGGYNFSWDVAEKAYAQDLVPHVISSDLQQFNVCSPVFSLANVMSVCMRIGMSLSDVIEKVTVAPARALSLADVAGALRPGMPADVTVFKIEEGAFQLIDCDAQFRDAEQRIAPVMAFKAGQKFDCDLLMAQDERKWFMQIAEDHVPAAAAHLTPTQRRFLTALTEALAEVDWAAGSAERLNTDKAYELHNVFHEVRDAESLPLRDALMGLFDCFIDDPFTMQVGLFLVRLERNFALERLSDVTGAKIHAIARA